MAKQRRTGPKAAKAASKVLSSKSTGKNSKTAAASALSQAAPKGGKSKGNLSSSETTKPTTRRSPALKVVGFVLCALEALA